MHAFVIKGVNISVLKMLHNQSSVRHMHIIKFNNKEVIKTCNDIYIRSKKSLYNSNGRISNLKMACNNTSH